METKKFYYEEIETPIGIMLAVGSKEKLYRLDFGTFEQRKKQHKDWFERFYEKVQFIETSTFFTSLKEQLSEYFAKGRKNFSIDFQLLGTSFQKKALLALYDNIKYGKTTTYMGLAEMINHPKAARAIGGTMNKNPISIIIPCHRVIGTNKKLTGYGGGLDTKEYLLKHEGFL